MGAMLLTALVVSTGSLNAILVDELEPIYPDRAPPALRSGLDVPRGGIASAHVWIDGVDAKLPIEVSVRGEHELPAPRWYRLLDVPVEENTGLGSRTERFKGDVNPHVIRRAPFRVYEVLKPIEGRVDDPGDQTALRVEWTAPLDAPPAAYDVELVLSQGDNLTVLPLSVIVHAAAVPPSGKGTLGYTNWFSPANIAKYHNLDLWSEPFWDMLGKYAALMRRGRQNMFWVRWPDFFDEVDGRWTLNEPRLVRYIDTFTNAGLHWIEGAPFAGRPGGDWGSPVLELKLGRLPMTGEAGREGFADQCTQLHAAMQANEWSDRWVQHIADEPTDTNAADYAVTAEMLRAHLPDVPIFEATMSRQLVGAVDMWCPQVQAWQAEQAFFDERTQAGDRVWVYTCLRPGGPWLNRLLDQERLRQVYFGWGAAKNGWDGYLHWGFNHWKANPFAQSVVDHPAMPNTDNRLPAGDTHVVFPGQEGPWSGLRFEAHRIGMEDHALLTQLAQHDPKRANSIMARIFRGADDYETDVAAYRASRQLLLKSLDEGVHPMHIEILGFPGCPMTPEMDRSVRTACTAIAPGAVVVSTDLSSLPSSDPRLRWPSPTVLVNGVDLFGASPAATPAISCRVYPGGLPEPAVVSASLAQLVRASH